MANLQFSNVSKTYASGTEAVKNFNLDIKDGEFVVIVGGSGCGKSTVLRMAAGLEEITTGELRMDGKIINDLSPKKRNVAMVFQNYALFPNLTVEDNIGFALKMQGVKKKERRERVLAMAKMLGIEELLHKKAKGLSGGQCQRIAIGRALACEPNIFLLDEPLSNLDATMRNDLRGEIAALQKRLGVTTLYVTHDLTEAMTLGTRVVVMNDGEIMQVDTPQNIYSRPQNVFVARFVGHSMNLFRARCVTQGNGAALSVDGRIVPLPQWKAAVLLDRGFADKEVLAGIRGEDIYPVCKGMAIPDIELTGVEAVVEAAEVLGAEKNLHMRLGETPLVATVRTYAAVDVGDTVELRLDAGRIHIFDAETETAII